MFSNQVAALGPPPPGYCWVEEFTEYGRRIVLISEARAQEIYQRQQWQLAQQYALHQQLAEQYALQQLAPPQYVQQFNVPLEPRQPFTQQPRLQQFFSTVRSVARAADASELHPKLPSAVKSVVRAAIDAPKLPPAVQMPFVPQPRPQPPPFVSPPRLHQIPPVALPSSPNIVHPTPIRPALERAPTPRPLSEVPRISPHVSEMSREMGWVKDVRTTLSSLRRPLVILNDRAL